MMLLQEIFKSKKEIQIDYLHWPEDVKRVFRDPHYILINDRGGNFRSPRGTETSPDEVFDDPQYHLNNKNQGVEIILMSPREYVTFSPPYGASETNHESYLVDMYYAKMLYLLGRENRMTDDDRANLANLDRMKSKYYHKDDKFPILVLDKRKGNKSQEGLHRALAAEKIGMHRVPVAIMHTVDHNHL